MRRVGRLVVVTGHTAVVELEPATSCARCARGRGCGAGLFAPHAPPLRLGCTLAVHATDPAHPTDRSCPPVRPSSDPPRAGDRVELEIPEAGAAWLRPVLLAYGLPTLGLLAGAFAPEPWAPIAALAGLGGGLLAWRAAARASGSRLDMVGPCPIATRIAPTMPRGSNR